MNNHPLFQAQLDLEEEMRSMGIARFREQVQEAKESGQETRGRAVRRLLGHYHSQMVEGIEAFMAEAKSGKAGRKHSALKFFDVVGDVDVLAHITLRVVLDSVTSRETLTRAAMDVANLLEDEVHFRQFIESDLWFVVSRPDGAYIEVISLEPGRADPGTVFTAHLDRRLSEANTTVSYDAASDTTSITMPFPRLPGEVWDLVAWGENAAAQFRPGRVVKWVAAGDYSLTVKGKLQSFFLGRRYTFRYKFSTLIIREPAAGGTGLQPVGEGRLQLRRMTLTFSETGYFRAIVTPLARDPYSYVFSGRVVGSARNKIGEIAVETGQFPFPIAAKNDAVSIELINDSYLPCAFTPLGVTRARNGAFFDASLQGCFEVWAGPLHVEVAAPERRLPLYLVLLALVAVFFYASSGTESVVALGADALVPSDPLAN